MNAEEIFHAALARAPSDRPALLAAACAGDGQLERRVEALLHAHEDPASFLAGQSPMLAVTSEESVAERPGTVIGPYKLLEQIGEGGFGTVFLAEQTDPVRRKVALKVLKAGMDTRQVVARFEAERQALALMDHPHIARVFDGGATPSGRPYFVMELVKGVPITDFCDRNHLSPRQRLELFVPLCQAIQHAHTKGIIHRDLKPSNVLVTVHDTVPVVKVIDFGVAKALGQALTDKTLFTGLAQMVGTPLYMSPEQAGQSGLDVDTRSDIYSLGVLLYELLTGTTPFAKERFKAVGYDEIQRIIREEDPPKPSTRVSTLGQAATTVSANRQSDQRRLSRLFRGELDWVVMKALEKDRNRRYETANGFAADVQRYLADEPVQACPPSAAYRLRKFVRRNRVALTSAGLVVLTLLTLTAGIGWNVRDRAAREAEKDREVDGALREAGRLRDRRSWTEAREVLKHLERLLAGGGREVQRQRLHAIVADLDLVARLEEIPLGDPGQPLFLSDRSQLDAVYAGAFRDYGIDVTALDAPAAADRIRASAIRAELAAALDDWLWAKYSKLRTWRILHSRERTPEVIAKEAGIGAEYEHLRAVADLVAPGELCRRIRDPEVQTDRRALEELAGRPEVADLPPSAAMNLARLLAWAGARDKAVGLLRAVQQRSPDDFLVNHELAERLPRRTPAEREEAIGFMRAAVAARPRYPTLHLRLGHGLRSAGRLDQAIAAYRTAFELQPGNDYAYAELAKALESQGKWDEALAVYGRYAALNPEKRDAHSSLGWAYLRRRQWDKAIASYQEACRLAPDLTFHHERLAWLLATCPDPGLRDAAQAVERAGTVVKLKPKSRSGWRVLGVARYRARDWAGAVAALEEADRLYTRGNPQVGFFLAMAHGRLGDPAKAREWYDRAARWVKDNPKPLNDNPAEQEEVHRFQAEAAELLGIEDLPRPAGEPPPKKP